MKRGDLLNIDTKNHLTFEMMKLKQTLKEKDVINLQRFHTHYLQMTTIPKKEVFKQKQLTFCSSKYSFHLLSIYLLLDMIEYFWDGKEITTRELKSDYSLLSDLNVEEATDGIPLELFINASKKVSTVIRDDLYIFLVPYKYNADYAVKLAYPGNVLLIYNNQNESPIDSFYKGVGDFYLKKKLKGKLPYWAGNIDIFKKEFVSWCKDETSLFKNR